MSNETAPLERVKSSIDAKPFFEDEMFVLYNVESIRTLGQIASPLWDLTVTSPPYNIGKAYESKRTLDEYVEWSGEWMKQVERTTVSDGTFWLNVGYTPIHPEAKALPLSYLLWDKVGMFFVQEVVWNYGAGVAGRKFYSPRNEKFLWYVKDNDRYTFNLDAVRDPNVKYPNQFKNGVRKVNTLGKNPSDVWQFPKVTSGRSRSSVERTSHPAQFPESVIDRIVLASSNIGDVVFDPFMGSGTTAVVAARHGRKTVGFELDEDYCGLAVARYERELTKAQALFD